MCGDFGGKMSRFFLVVVLAVVASFGNALGQSTGPTEEGADNACSALANIILVGLPGTAADVSNATKVCNAHPRRDECLHTKRFIERHGKTVPELTCGGASTAPAGQSAARRPAAAAESLEYKTSLAACGLIMNRSVNRPAPGNESDQVALCNESNEVCSMTKTYIASLYPPRLPPPGLTCE